MQQVYFHGCMDKFIVNAQLLPNLVRRDQA